MDGRLVGVCATAFLTAALVAPPAAHATALRKVDIEEGAGAESKGLFGPDQIVISPDQRHVYVSNNEFFGSSGAISVFARDLATGELTFVEAEPLQTTEFGSEAIAVSPDGLHLYAAVYGQLITTYARNPLTGALSALDTISAATFVSDSEVLAASPDGRFLFSTGFAKVASYTRDATTAA
jgi:DNA-binding beta-propeller fold protein YncE